jgi:FixJ family two-component response regulator
MEFEMRFFPTEAPFTDSAGPISPACDRPESSKSSQGIPTVFIVDPDNAARESLSALITRQGWHPEIFTCAEEFLAQPVEFVPGCLTLDVCLPGLSGLELQKHAATKCPHLPTIFLSAEGDIPTTVEAMKTGAVEFLLKPFRDNELLSALREALERSRLVIARETQKRAIRKCYASLSLRERQVMGLVSSGLLNKEVGCELGISEITVKAHRGRVMRKMRAASLADLMKMAGKLGLARARKATVFPNRIDQAACPSSQPNGNYAFVA